MTSILQRKRFFSSSEGSGGGGSIIGNCSSSSSTDLPLLQKVESASSSVSSCYPSSPPSSGNLQSYVMDVNQSRIPGRASSMSIVRQRSGVSLSPTKTPPRKSISMFFRSSSSSQPDASQLEMPLHNNHYSGMPLVRSNSNHHNHKTMLTNWVCTMLSVMGLVVLAVLMASSYNHNTRLQYELQFKDQEIEMHLEHAHALERRVQTMRSETIHLHNRIEELENPAPTEEELAIQRKVFHLEHYQQQVHRGIQEQAKRLVTEKFGPGPKYYIAMKLQFNPESNIVQDATTEIGDTIWLETATLDEMPHTLHFFLEQIANHVYDGTTFYRNAPRFIQAGPGHSASKLHELEEHEPSLAHVLFQEHSPNLDHQQYTLGYPGRPGGPDFYLNIQDNSEHHGPGAGINHRSDYMTEADPCFARVIRGFNTIERIHRSNVHEDDLSFRRQALYQMVHPVTIVSMRVINMDSSHTYPGSFSQDRATPSSTQ